MGEGQVEGDHGERREDGWAVSEGVELYVG
jgi:hypothetical protein